MNNPRGGGVGRLAAMFPELGQYWDEWCMRLSFGGGISHEEYEDMPYEKHVFWFGLLEAKASHDEKLHKEREKRLRQLYGR